MNTGSYHPTEAGRQGCYHLRLVYSKGMAPEFLKKTFLYCKAGRKLGGDLHLKEAKKEFAASSFLK